MPKKNLHLTHSPEFVKKSHTFNFYLVNHLYPPNLSCLFLEIFIRARILFRVKLSSTTVLARPLASHSCTRSPVGRWLRSKPPTTTTDSCLEKCLQPLVWCSLPTDCFKHFKVFKKQEGQKLKVFPCLVLARMRMNKITAYSSLNEKCLFFCQIYRYLVICKSCSRQIEKLNTKIKESVLFFRLQFSSEINSFFERRSVVKLI